MLLVFQAAPMVAVSRAAGRKTGSSVGGYCSHPDCKGWAWAQAVMGGDGQEDTAPADLAGAGAGLRDGSQASAGP